MKSNQKPVHVHAYLGPKGVIPNGIQAQGGNENVVQAHNVKATECLAMLKEATSGLSSVIVLS